MAKVEKSFEAVCDFMARDQFLEACSRELFSSFEVESVRESWCDGLGSRFVRWSAWGVFSCVNKGQRDNNKGAAQSKPERYQSGSLKLNMAFAEKAI